MAARVSPAAPWAARVSLAAPWVVVSAPWSCAACTFRNEGEAAACAVCLARRAQGAASAAPLTAALVESWSAADVARWVASLPGMTRAHGAVFVRGEVTGRRLLRMRVPELVAAGLLVGPAVDVDEALQRVRGAGAGDGRGAGAGDGRGGGDAALPQGPSLFEYLAATTTWAGVGLSAGVSAGAAAVAATAAGLGRQVAATSERVASHPSVSPHLSAFNCAFAEGALPRVRAAGYNAGTLASDAVIGGLAAVGTAGTQASNLALRSLSLR